MGFEGSFNIVSFADILNTLCKINKEGTLTVFDGKSKKTIHFLDNGVTLIGENQIELLGERLVQEEKVKDWELKNALNEKEETGKSLDIILLDQGLVNEEEIEHFIYEHMEGEICDIFFWENANFIFEDGPPQDESFDNQQTMTFTFDVQSLLFRIAEQLEEWKKIREKIPSLKTVFVIRDKDNWNVNKELEGEFQEVGKLIDGTHDIREIIRITNLPVIVVCRLLSLMLLHNLIQAAEYEDFVSKAAQTRTTGNVQLQIHLLQKALSLNDNDEKLMLEIARCYESVSNKKKAAKWYVKLAECTQEEKDVLHYLEIAISCNPKLIDPYNEFILLLKNAGNMEKVAFFSLQLAKIYEDNQKINKALSICEELDDTFYDQSLSEYLIELYISNENIEKAFTYYNKIFDITKKSRLDVLIKIANIPSENKILQKTIKQKIKKIQWDEKRNFVYGILTIGVLILIIGSYFIFYELKARSLNRSAEVLFVNNDFNISFRISNEIITNYSWSSVTNNAQNNINRINQHFAQKKIRNNKIKKKQLEKITAKLEDIEMLVVAKLFKQAEQKLKTFEKEYYTPRWSNFHFKIKQLVAKTKILIKKTKIKNNAQRLLSLREKANREEEKDNISVAIEIWKELLKHENYKDEATRSITRIHQSEVIVLTKNIKKKLKESETFEKNGELKQAYSSYIATEKLIQEVKRKILADDSIYYVTDTLRLVENGKKRIEKWELQIRLKWNEILDLQEQKKAKIAHSKTLEILRNNRLSKTSFSKNIKLFTYIKSTPTGAKIKGTNLSTPCFYEVDLKDINKKIELQYNSFETLKVSISAKNPIYNLKFKKKKLWKKKINARITALPIIHKKKLLLINSRGSIIAMSKKSGNKIWKFNTQKGFGDIIGNIKIFQENIYFGSNDYFFYSININNGKINWKFKTNYFIQNTPNIDEKNVFFGTQNGNAYCLNRISGKKIWSTKIPGSIYAQPVIWKSNILFVTTQGFLVNLDIFTGKVNWQKKFLGKISNDGILRGNLFYIVTKKGYLYCFDVEKKQKIWHKKLDCEISNLFIWGANVYANDKNGLLYGMDKETGTTLWKKDIGVHSNIVISQDKQSFYAINSEAKIVILNFDGNIIWNEKLIEKSGKTHILSDENAVYLFSQSGQIYALKN